MISVRRPVPACWLIVSSVLTLTGIHVLKASVARVVQVGELEFWLVE